MPARARLPIVGVMGSGTSAHSPKASPLGRWLAEIGVHLLTGGGAGVMEAVSHAFHHVPNRRGSVIAVLPCEAGGLPERTKAGYPNSFVEIPIRTHLPLSGTQGTEAMSRNHINVLSSDVIVALPGGAGTASEVSLCVRYAKPVVAFLATSDQLPAFPATVPVHHSLDAVQAFVVCTLRGAGFNVNT